ncbi:MAG: sialidase family protein [Planctomycetota bacterium]|nr:sialidase family protein [Planctomycetota bacterium]
MRCFLWMALFALCVGIVRADDELKLIGVQKIWDEAPHNAFTDLVRFKNSWFCVFREGAGHVSPDGALRVITSTDGEHWKSAARIVSSDSDLRDAKITITPKGQLMLSGAEALHDKSQKSHQSLAWFSDDGHTWSESYEIGDANFWLWRTTWHKDTAYSVGYDCTETNRQIRLYTSQDGKAFRTIVPNMLDAGYPNETSILFDDDTAYCLLRRDLPPNSKDASLATALLGVAHPPYTQWQWKDLGMQLGGPHMIRLPDGRYVASGRISEKPTHTSLCWLDPEKGTLREFLKLPSKADTSYPGLVLHEGILWVSYYSSHEGKTSIYLARVKIGAQS